MWDRYFLLVRAGTETAADESRVADCASNQCAGAPSAAREAGDAVGRRPPEVAPAKTGGGRRVPPVGILAFSIMVATTLRKDTVYLLKIYVRAWSLHFYASGTGTRNNVPLFPDPCHPSSSGRLFGMFMLLGGNEKKTRKEAARDESLERVK